MTCPAVRKTKIAAATVVSGAAAEALGAEKETHSMASFALDVCRFRFHGGRRLLHVPKDCDPADGDGLREGTCGTMFAGASARFLSSFLAFGWRPLSKPDRETQ